VDICLSISEVNWEVTKDVFSIIGTMGFLIIGALGINEWKKQHKSTADHELAKKLIAETYRWRQAIQNVRNPVLHLRKEEVEEGRQTQEKQRIYGERLDALLKKWTDIEALKFEADVIWGAAQTAPLLTIKDLTSKIKSELWLHFWLQGAYAPLGAHVDRSIERIRANDEFVCYMSEEDAFSVQINDAVTAVESAFRKRIL
jgi:cell fate (sporulation/competence/biofilm development) regulator YlbF (YheA/YmcA/DUF963 family)